MKSLDYKVVNLDGEAICYFETELEAEEFIHNLDAKEEFRIEDPEKVGRDFRPAFHHPFPAQDWRRSIHSYARNS